MVCADTNTRKWWCGSNINTVGTTEVVSANVGVSLRVLTGPTGCGKTRVLHYLRTQGHQMLDLEALANHRGSVLGACSSAQPSQKWFESMLARELERMDAARPVFVEDEAPYIGTIHIPPALWQRMLTAPRFMLETPLEMRVRYTLEEYAHLTNQSEANHLKQCLEKLAKHHSESTLSAWRALIDECKYGELVGDLLTKHYDPANRRSSIARCRNKHSVVHIGVTGLDAEALARDLPPSRYFSFLAVLVQMYEY
jgi:tRNA 2-selenouridine synthase